MKNIILLNILLIAVNIFGQKGRTDCYSFMNFEENEYFCDTTYLSNGSKLYYQWNCDSTWLTFENQTPVTLNSCTYISLILCSRLGLSYLKEYPNYLFFIHNWISGCCTPPDLVFIDKLTGKEKKRIANDLFVWGDTDKDYALYFSDTTYTNLIYLNHLSNNKSTYQFEDSEVAKSITKNNTIHLNDLFKNFIKEENSLRFEFTNEEGVIVPISIEPK
jgi:hypothetical protein